MKKLLSALSLVLALLLLATGCTGQKAPADTTADAPTEAPTASGETDPPTEIPTDTPTEPAESDTEPEAEPAVPVLGERIDLTALELTAQDGQVGLTLSADIREEGLMGIFSAVLSDGEGIISEMSLEIAGEITLFFDCPPQRLMGELTLEGSIATPGGEVLDKMILKMKNGLPQLTPDGVRCVVAAMTAEEKAHMVTGVLAPVKQGASGGTYAIDRLGIPSITVNDGPAGVRYSTAVWYPSVHNLTASWDPALIAQVGQAIGEDSLALGIDIVLGPGMNIQKNVLCGRNFEYCSEDPILTGIMSSAYVKGMQSTGAGACIKHFAANNQETARGSTSANVTERALREIYLKAFGMVVADANPLTVMSSYNCLNGDHTSVKRELLTDILRGEFGFEGFVMSDWGAVGSMTDKVGAGNDINMPGNETDPADVLNAYKAGLIDDLALNTCCRNILTVVAQSPTCQGVKMNTRVDAKNHHKVASEAAADTVILLQNTGAALPLSKDTSVAVFGNGAYQTVFGGAGSGSVSPSTTVSIMDGLRKADGLTVANAKNNPFRNCAPHDAMDPSKDVAVTEAYATEMAEEADAALIVISRGSTEGQDRSDLKGDFRLNDTEADMINRVSAAFRAKGKKVIVVLNMGSPMEVVSWRDKVDAILYLGYAGQGSGTALAQVLTGEVNPSAKTAMTWPVDYDSTPAADYFPGSAKDVTYYEDIYVGYRYYTTFGVGMAYPFGFGLSYTSYEYSELAVKQNPDGTLSAWITVTNTGSCAGREIVQLYITKPETLQEQAALELCGFAKTDLLSPGESQRVYIRASVESLMTYDTAESRWILDKGDYTVSVGASSADLKAKATVSMGEITVVQDVENRCAPDTKFDYIQKATYKVPDPTKKRENLALNKPASSNYSESDSLNPSLAVDGSATTRWSGTGLSTGTHYWQVDLGQVYAVGEVDILWESIYAPFTVLLSEDGKSFTAYKVYVDDGSMVTEINLKGAKTRFIRLEIPRGNYVSIYEFRAYAATDEDIAAGKEEAERVNIAKDQSVTATAQEGAYMKENAVDGDLTTRWGSLPSGEAWLQVDLGKVCTVKGIEAFLEAAWVPYRIEYSADGEHYETLRTCRKDELTVVMDDLNIEARYIRLSREGENWFSIYEIAVYGR